MPNSYQQQKKFQSRSAYYANHDQISNGYHANDQAINMQCIDNQLLNSPCRLRTVSSNPESLESLIDEFPAEVGISAEMYTQSKDFDGLLSHINSRSNGLNDLNVEESMKWVNPNSYTKNPELPSR